MMQFQNLLVWPCANTDANSLNILNTHIQNNF